MKIVLLGYGKMGREIEGLVKKTGHSITGIYSATKTLNTDTSAAIQAADVAIDFSSLSAVEEHVSYACQYKKPIVIGTTGWTHNLPKVQALVEKHHIGALYSPNFSLGVYLFLKLIEKVATLIPQYPEFDVAISEMHHNQKKDAPSGTAKAMEAILLNNLQTDSIQISSLRCGAIPGIHSLICNSPNDMITITHQAQNRSGFALGAIKAAEWLIGKTGFYTLEDMLGGL